ncbi:MAG: DUF427 domain-containing protein [Allgaiera sp.]|jgi:uncharacterized protein (DUF427 family)|nr:DUF427 domain-containing protein [Allgaiera sp.]
MPDRISIVKVPGTWVVLAGGAILGETKAAMELTEGDYPPVIYFPREDIAMAFLDRSETSSTCPWKGEASYFSIVTKSTTLHDAAWSYETPTEGAERIKGHIAFYPDKTSIERI